MCKIRSSADKWQVRQRFCETLGHDKVPQFTYIHDLRGLRSLQLLTLSHTNVLYKLCEQDWRGLRFGYGYEILGRAGDDWGKVKPGTFVYNVETGI